MNTASQASLDFQRNGAVSTFNGSLDSLTGARRTDYTAEFEYFFVNESDKDWYVTADTNAEVWVFIDGRLVIDGGGVGGVNFTITNGSVVPTEDYNASITVIGAAIQSGTVNCPVTLKAKVGANWLEPFGSYNSSSAGNVNNNGNPRSATLGSNLPAGTAISVTGRSWTPSGNSFASYLAIDSASNSSNVRVLRNGDTAPDIKPFQNQASVKSFLAPYIDATTKRVTLQANQAIFLYELGTTNMSNAAADFQDLVVLVSLTKPNTPASTTPTTTTTYTPVSSLRQRIDLSRLDWLQDRGTHRIKFLFANRTGAESTLKLETNITTLNLANMPAYKGMD